ncbi:hypothetical protein BRCON_2720 [Candidatus Sumerlaea chitinivorans]|uniref:Uncharacterized protein n=1 Tax=Sumerlaea chitinivorans TaxID=2250252 RepID=A0A2Z4YA27_SUMC1|nr:hypothetical protein BRCON_2720 [Candidatus Sumerlaea chitinivorans]
MAEEDSAPDRRICAEKLFAARRRRWGLRCALVAVACPTPNLSPPKAVLPL